MEQVWFVAALWLLLALVAVLAANWLRISTALSEIVVGTVAQLIIGALAGAEAYSHRRMSLKTGREVGGSRVSFLVSFGSFGADHREAR
jgi:hypothetical protein